MYSLLCKGGRVGGCTSYYARGVEWGGGCTAYYARGVEGGGCTAYYARGVEWGDILSREGECTTYSARGEGGYPLYTSECIVVQKTLTCFEGHWAR